MAQTYHALPPLKRFLVAVTVMLGTLMVVLDTTIANVALPHMQAGLGASQETISWVLTSYIVASAVATPLTGWLADRYGRRLLFSAAIAGFTVSSMLCGVATTLPALVAARLLQGVFGAFIVPLSQSAMYDINPPHKHAQAMAIWGMGVMVGPLLGPMVGGWLTDNFSWRWCFFVNVPLGALGAVASWLLLADTRRIERRFDLLGFGLLALLLIAFQLALDRGTNRDWFDSVEIVVEAAVAVAALWMFVVHSLTARDPIVSLGLFRDRTFVSGLVLIAVMGGVLTAGSALIAPFLQGLMGYSVQDAGMLVMPRGAGTMLGMLIAGRLANRTDPRMLIVGGMLLVGYSLHMMTGFTTDMNARPVISSGLIQGFGIGFVVMPLNFVTFTTLKAQLRTDGAAMYSLLRNVGGSVGIAAMTALLARNLQASHSSLAGNFDPAIQQQMHLGVLERLGASAQTGFAVIDAEINRQATLIAYIDDFWLMMWGVVLTAPLILLMRRPARRRAGDAPVVDAGH